MEVKTVPASEANTGSRTIADIVLLAGRRQPTVLPSSTRPASWVDVSYRELSEAVKEVALGLVDFGIERGDRISILSNTRPEWTYANFGILAAGAASVSIYQTNSPEECHYVLGHSESRAVFVEDAEQLAKVRQVQAQLPELELIVGCRSRAAATATPSPSPTCASAAGAATTPSSRSASPRSARTTTASTSTPPARPGRRRAACSPTATTARSARWPSRRASLAAGEVVYLFLPLAHAFAVLIQFIAMDLGATIAYWEKDPLKIVPNLSEVKPTYFPSVPRIFEKVYTMATAEGRGGRGSRRRSSGGRRDRRKVRELERRASSRASCSSASTTSPTSRCSRRSATSSAASCARP